jgi:hypothetical protein
MLLLFPFGTLMPPFQLPSSGLAALGKAPHLPSMTLELTGEEFAALLRELGGIIANDRYFCRRALRH